MDHSTIDQVSLPSSKPSDHDSQNLVLEYYKHQWEQIEFRRQERTQLTIQLLIAASALAVAYSQLQGSLLKTATAGFIVLLGVVGLYVTYFLDRDIRIHWLRTREARKRIALFEEIASVVPPGGGRFASPHYSYAISLTITAIGILLVAFNL